jgi:TolA-binding protein
MIRRFPPSPLPLRAATSLLLALAASAGARAEGTPAAEKPAANASAAVAQEIPAAGETPSGAPPAPLPLAGASAAPAKPAEPPKRAKDEIHGLLNLGASLTERGDYAAAEIAIRQVLDAPEAGPTETKTALLELARMHRRQGALTKAAAIYERYLKDYSGDERVPDALLELGRTLRDLGVYKMAVTCFYNVINSTLKLPADEGFDHYQVLAKTAQFEIAETHFQAGEFAEANKFYTRLRLLDLAPSDRARAHFKAGYALRLQGDLEGAVATLRSYIAQWPDDENIPEARYLLAITLRELKRPQEAFAATLELLRTEKSRVATDPKRWAYWQRRTGNQLANDFFESGDTLNAHAIYAGLLELSPEPSWRLPITYQLALCYERLGITDRARLSYKSIVDSVGPNPPADLAELARMAAWRIEHLEWRERVGDQIAKYFNTTTGSQPTALLSSPTPPKN